MASLPEKAPFASMFVITPLAARTTFSATVSPTTTTFTADMSTVEATLTSSSGPSINVTFYLALDYATLNTSMIRRQTRAMLTQQIGISDASIGEIFFAPASVAVITEMLDVAEAGLFWTALQRDKLVVGAHPVLAVAPAPTSTSMPDSKKQDESTPLVPVVITVAVVVLIICGVVLVVLRQRRLRQRQRNVRHNQSVASDGVTGMIPNPTFSGSGSQLPEATYTVAPYAAVAGPNDGSATYTLPGSVPTTTYLAPYAESATSPGYSTLESDHGHYGTSSQPQALTKDERNSKEADAPDVPVRLSLAAANSRAGAAHALDVPDRFLYLEPNELSSTGQSVAAESDLAKSGASGAGQAGAADMHNAVSRETQQRRPSLSLPAAKPDTHA